MKKSIRIILCLFVICLLPLFSACGGNGDDSFGSSEKPAESSSEEPAKMQIVTFVSDGATVKTSEIVFGEFPELPTAVPEKAGYTFIGWTLDAEGKTAMNERNFKKLPYSPTVTVYANLVVTQSMVRVSADDARIVPLGRISAIENGRVVCDYALSGISFTFTGTNVSIRVAEAAGSTIIQATLDGVELPRKTVTPNTWETLAKDIPYGEHEIRIYKDTQCSAGRLVIDGVSVQAAEGHARICEPEESTAPFIEFYGDSITNGSNALRDTEVNPYWNSPTHGYAYYTAKEFGADLAVIGMGGLSFLPSTNPNVPYHMSQLVESASYPPSDDYPVMYAKNPDLVVMALGTNDADNLGKSEFKREVNLVLDKLRNMYGEKQKILWLWGFSCYEQGNWSQMKAILDARHDPYLYYCADMTNVSTPVAKGGDGLHPLAADAQIMASEIAAFITENGLLD